MSTFQQRECASALDPKVLRAARAEIPCAWCGREVSPRGRGSPQRFCSAHHRSLFDSAARRWVSEAIGCGLLTVTDLRNVSRRLDAERSARAASHSVAGVSEGESSSAGQRASWPEPVTGKGLP
jgi:hypothetical protein